VLNSIVREVQRHASESLNIPDDTSDEYSRGGLALVRGRVIVWHDRALGCLLGYGPHELVGYQTRLFYADEGGYRTCGQALYGPDGAGVGIAVELVSADGKRVPCLLSAHAIEGAGSGGLWLIHARRLPPGSAGKTLPGGRGLTPGSIARAMAGELRNPLSVVRGYAQLLVEELKDTAAARHAEEVLKAADELAARMGAFLSFFAAGDAPRRVCDLNGLMADLAAELESLASSYLVQVKGEFDRLPCFVHGDKGVLRYALFELAWAVLDAMRNRPLSHLRVRCAAIRKRREVEVIIEGTGAAPSLGRSPAKDAERVSAPGDRGTPSLAVAQAAILSCGGRVILHANQQGELIRAVVYIPEAQGRG